MPPVSTNVGQQFQWGAEATPNAGGAASKKFGETIFTPNFAGDVFTHMGQGVKGITSTTQGSQWTELDISGPWNFNDLAVLFAIHGTYAAPVVTGSVALWTLEPSLISMNSPKTLVGQYGDANRVREIKNIIIPTLGLKAARGGLEVSGKAIGNKDTDIAGFTASPTQLDIATADEVAVDVWCTTVLADLTNPANKFLGAYVVDVGMNDLYVPDFPLNSAEVGFSGTNEQVPGITVKITTRTDAEGWALYDSMAVGQHRFLRLKVTGPLISGTDYNSLTFDMPIIITKVPSYEEVDAVHGITYEAGAVVDSDFGGKLYKAVLQNTLLAL